MTADAKLLEMTNLLQRKFMRHTFNLWANCFPRAGARGQAYYLKKRKEQLGCNEGNDP